MSASPVAARRTVARGGADLVLVLLGCGVLPLAAWPVDAGRVPGAEAAVFRVVNGTTVLPFVVVWPVMQLGNVVVVPVSAFVVGGAALGLAVAGLVRLAFGRPA